MPDRFTVNIHYAWRSKWRRTLHDVYVNKSPIAYILAAAHPQMGTDNVRIEAIFAVDNDPYEISKDQLEQILQEYFPMSQVVLTGYAAGDHASLWGTVQKAEHGFLELGEWNPKQVEMLAEDMGGTFTMNDDELNEIARIDSYDTHDYEPEEE